MPGLERRMQLVAAPGLAVYCLLVTIVSIDLLMSLDPHWYSAIYGMYVVGGQAISGMAFTLLVSLFLVRKGPMRGVLQPRHVHDHGNLLLAFTMLWAYFARLAAHHHLVGKPAGGDRLLPRPPHGRLGRPVAAPRPLSLRRAVRLPPLARLQARHLGSWPGPRGSSSSCAGWTSSGSPLPRFIPAG